MTNVSWRFRDFFPLRVDQNKMSLFNFVTGFIVGTYAGLYAAKHYNVPDIPEPKTIINAVTDFLDNHKKDKKDD